MWIETDLPLSRLVGEGILRTYVERDEYCKQNVGRYTLYQRVG
jgi:hypothetical protein